MTAIIEKVDRLEDLMASLLKQTEITTRELARVSREADKRIEEMRRETDRRREDIDKQIKEMRRGTDRHREDIDKQIKEMKQETDRRREDLGKQIKEMRRETDRRREDIDKQIKEMKQETDRRREGIDKQIKEMRRGTDRHREDIDKQIKEMRRETDRRREEADKKFNDYVKEWHKEFSALARKMGTLIEDIFYPSIDIVLKQYFNCTISSQGIRMKRVMESDVMEIDILVTCKEKTVFIVEVKSNPNRVDYIYDFQKNLNRFSNFYPEYSEYEKVPVYAAISTSQEIINKLTKEKIYAMVLRGDVLDIINAKDIQMSQKSY